MVFTKNGCNHKDFSIVVKITLTNKRNKLRHNVTIYLDVMLFGDGFTDICNNIGIRNVTPFRRMQAIEKARRFTMAPSLRGKLSEREGICQRYCCRDSCKNTLNSGNRNESKNRSYTVLCNDDI